MISKVGKGGGVIRKLSKVKRAQGGFSFGIFSQKYGVVRFVNRFFYVGGLPKLHFFLYHFKFRFDLMKFLRSIYPIKSYPILTSFATFASPRSQLSRHLNFIKIRCNLNW